MKKFIFSVFLIPALASTICPAEDLTGRITNGGKKSGVGQVHKNPTLNGRSIVLFHESEINWMTYTGKQQVLVPLEDPNAPESLRVLWNKTVAVWQNGIEAMKKKRADAVCKFIGEGSSLAVEDNWKGYNYGYVPVEYVDDGGELQEEQSSNHTAITSLTCSSKFSK